MKRVYSTQFIQLLQFSLHLLKLILHTPYSKPLQNKLRISFKTYRKKLQYGTAEHNWEAIHCPCADGNKAHQQKTRQIKEPMKQATELPACHPHR